MCDELGNGEDIDRFVMHEECSHEESVIFTVQFFRTFVLNLVSRHPIMCWYLLEIDFLDENTDNEKYDVCLLWAAGSGALMYSLGSKYF